MTEKRFTILYGIDENPFEWDIMDNEKDALICQYNGKPICDLLNELAEENEQLKKDCTVLIYHNQEYRKENEQLKADKKALIDFIRKEFPKSHKHILEGFE